MTDRYNALVVVLDQNTRSDDAEPLINAIRMMRGVTSVHPETTGAVADVVARSRVQREFEEKLYALLAEMRKQI